MHNLHTLVLKLYLGYYLEGAVVTQNLHCVENCGALTNLILGMRGLKFLGV